MENNNRMLVGWRWKKRRIRYVVNNNIVVKILKRVGYELRELFWLGIGVGILVVVVNLFCI
jgi:hypothetical protein